MLNSYDKLVKLLRLAPHHQWLDLQLESIVQHQVTTHLAFRDDLADNYDSQELSRSTIQTLVDATSGIAVLVKLGAMTRITTLNLRIEHTRAPIRRGSLYSRCECYDLCDGVARVRGTVFQEQNADRKPEIAIATGTYMLAWQRLGASL